MIGGINRRAGAVRPSSQLVTVFTSVPTCFPTSFCRNPKSSRRLRMWSPMVLSSAG